MDLTLANYSKVSCSGKMKAIVSRKVNKIVENKIQVH